MKKLLLSLLLLPVLAGAGNNFGILDNTSATISGGTINSTPIGATTPSTGAFTTLTATTPLAKTSGGTGNTTGTATVNANLTGVITSVGNATSIASQTGTGTKFVTDTSPTLVTPVLGVAAATSINFGQTALANYTEGTWTPVITFGTPGNLSVTYSYQVGTYTRIGNRVTLNFAISTSAFTFTTASGLLEITGIPFNGEATTHNTSVGACGFNGITKANFTVFSPTVAASNNTLITITASGSGQGITSVLATDTPTGGTLLLWCTLTYQV